MSVNIAYALAFSRVSGLGPKKLLEFKEEILSLQDTQAAYPLLTKIQKKYTKQIKNIPDPDEFSSWISASSTLLEQQEDSGIHSIAYTDGDYPENFKRLDTPPLYFFYKGNQEALYQKGIAVIGTREVTGYTREVGKHIGQYIAKKGFNVISGLALGSDAAGHQGCLDAGGTTIAIVSTPLDQVYPRQNTQLQNEILDNGGCVISEYPIGTPFMAQHLIARDRLQSGLANGVFVVATGEKGGTWHAINGAIKLKIPLCYFDYTRVKAYNYKADIHTQGMQKMASVGGYAICSPAEFDDFLNKCSAENTSPVTSVTAVKHEEDQEYGPISLFTKNKDSDKQ